jgi:phospholipase C
MRMNLLSAVAMSSMAAAVVWSGQVAADDFHGNDPDFGRHDNHGHYGGPQNGARTATPIKHLVIIFNENVSFDHYFATYPHATNPPGQPVFKAARNTPTVNNLAANPYLLNNNGNFINRANGTDAANPFRLDRTQANTVDQSPRLYGRAKCL